MVQKSDNLTLKQINYNGFKKVIQVIDESKNLLAFIAIHSTQLGPSLGGVRIYPYLRVEDALEDVLRLSRGMTYKSAAAGLMLGGGKSVILADPKTQKTPELLRSFGQAVEQLKGEYICAEDVGCTVRDVEIISEETSYVVGTEKENSSGDPSPYTAHGVVVSAEATIQKLWNKRQFKGLKVAIQGLGAVGEKVAQTLYWQGAQLFVSDVDQNKVSSFCKRFGATAVSAEEIYRIECDLFMPCALGGILNTRTIPQLKCKAVVGCANNQLLEESDAELLQKVGILYAPDFIVNAGGLINVAHELMPKGYQPQASLAATSKIFTRLMEIYDIAEQNRISTNQAALVYAQSFIDEYQKI